MLESLFTGSGFWNPLAWIAALVVSILLIIFLRSFGKREFKKETEQTTPFLSGMPAAGEEIRVRSGNLYWGFVEALKGYYESMKKLHSGDLRDYILWFVIIIVITFVIVYMGAIKWM